MLEGTILVVSPLISLMKDQVDELARRGIPAAADRHAPIRTAESIDAWIDAAVAGGCISVSTDKCRTLGLTPLGRAVTAERVIDARLPFLVARRPARRWWRGELARFRTWHHMRRGTSLAAATSSQPGTMRWRRLPG